MKYPFTELKFNSRNKNQVTFVIHLNSYMKSSITLVDNRVILRKILNPNYQKRVSIYTKKVQEDRYFFTILFLPNLTLK